MGRLAGKVAYVLGAAGQGNMGQVIAQRFAAEGATVAVGAGSVAACSCCSANTLTGVCKVFCSLSSISIGESSTVNPVAMIGSKS